MTAVSVVDVSVRTGWDDWALGASIDPPVHEKVPVSVNEPWSLVSSPRLPPDRANPPTTPPEATVANSPLWMSRVPAMSTATVAVVVPLATVALATPSGAPSELVPENTTVPAPELVPEVPVLSPSRPSVAPAAAEKCPSTVPTGVPLPVDRVPPGTDTVPPARTSSGRCSLAVPDVAALVSVPVDVTVKGPLCPWSYNADPSAKVATPATVKLPPL